MLGDDYCSGYTDQHGKWNTGFYCPSKSNDEVVFCCGNQTYKYCCIRRHTIHPTDHPTRTQLEYVVFCLTMNNCSIEIVILL